MTTPAAPSVLDALHQQIADVKSAQADAAASELESTEDGGDTTSEQEATSEPEEKPEPKPSISERQKALREQMLEKQKHREATRSEVSAQEFEQLRHQVSQLHRTPSVNDFLDRARRDPKGMAEALRSEGINPEDVLRELTNDVLSPGAARAAAVGSDALEYTKNLAREVEKLKRDRQVEAEQRQIDAEERAFIDYVNSDDFPSLKALNADERIEEALKTWADLQRRGIDYDRELVAVETEARLAKYRERWLPKASTPDSTKKPPAAKNKLTTLKPELAGEGGSKDQPYRTQQQRDAAQIARLRMQLRK